MPTNLKSSFISKTEILVCYGKKKYKLHLHEIKKEEIMEYRKSGKPGMVVLVDKKFFYTPVKKEWKFVSQKLMGEHVCAMCRKVSPLLCEKVADLSVEFHSKKEEEDPYTVAKRLEKYDFVLEGYETFNTDFNVLVITKCKNVNDLKSKEKQEIPAEKVSASKVALAQYVWPDIDTEEDVQKRLRKNLYKIYD